MAQTKGQQRGNAANAPKSVPLNNEPDGQNFLDITEHLRGRREITVRAKAVKQYHGWGPGDDLSAAPRTVGLCPGAVARLNIDPNDHDPQNAMVLAYAVARGYIDIVPDSEMNSKTPSHDECWDEHNRRLAERELRNAEGPAPGTMIEVMQAQMAQMQARIDSLEGAGGKT